MTDFYRHNQIFSLNSLYSLILGFLVFSCSQSDKENKDYEEIVYNFTTRIPVGGNSWIKNSPEKTKTLVFDTGIHNWTSTDDILQTYFATSQSGNLQIGLSVKVLEGLTDLQVILDGNVRELKLSNATYKDIGVAEFEEVASGYHTLELKAKRKTGNDVADVQEILLGGSVASSEITFIKETENFYFGRRGPSDHLNFTIPEDKELLYFYSEIEVPQGQDKIGSYFMADGFNYGYFGIQVNSDKERRVIFSVWSPYVTDDPAQIPEDQRIILLKKGEDVNAGEFGNEGSGGHSHLVYNWRAASTYKFLLKGEPSIKGSSDYTAYFYAPELGEWQLIASFRRPQTSSYLKGFYSFLENFNPNTGNQKRKAFYKNQWVYDTTGTWTEITEATFSVDATARAGRRLDYGGGSKDYGFYLKNCGFFNAEVTPGTVFQRAPSYKEPRIDLNQFDGIINN